jgi:RimJ/RimL family protein N-acetyltransferase
MMIHLGGAESSGTIAKRHERYCRLSEYGKGCMFVVIVDGLELGSVGYWDRLWQDHTVWELGWSILPEYQGRGVATKATAVAIEHARADGTYRFAHAFPSKDNEPSNAICRKIGFEFRGICEFEYPAGHFMKCVDWRFDLFPSASEQAPG